MLACKKIMSILRNIQSFAEVYLKLAIPLELLLINLISTKNKE